MLTVALTGGFLAACLFYSHAQCDDRRGDVLGAEVDETLSENLEEECLAEKLPDFSGRVFVSKYKGSPASRFFGPCIYSTASSAVIGFQDWMIPLRI